MKAFLYCRTHFLFVNPKINQRIDQSRLTKSRLQRENEKVANFMRPDGQSMHTSQVYVAWKGFHALNIVPIPLVKVTEEHRNKY
jgi:hypothetical protein